jgi:hypothetical protein
MAHQLAHRINNPLQSLTNTIFLARHGKDNVEEYLVQAEADLQCLSQQVAKLLNLSGRSKTNDLVVSQDSITNDKTTRKYDG